MLCDDLGGRVKCCYKLNFYKAIRIEEQWLSRLAAAYRCTYLMVSSFLQRSESNEGEDVVVAEQSAVNRLRFPIGRKTPQVKGYRSSHFIS